VTSNGHEVGRYIHGFCIHRFNQPWVNSILKTTASVQETIGFFSGPDSLAIQYNNYLHGIYVVLGIINNLEMI
jgi:hypothetical protein